MSEPIEKLCRNCCWYNANQGVEIHDSPDKQCFKHNRWTDDDLTCDDFLGSNDTSVNVPNHLKLATMTEPNPNKLDGPTEIMVNSYHKDLPWLVWALRCMKKYMRGFSGITIVHPRTEAHLFEPLRNEFDPIRLLPCNEPSGKGMLYHMVQMARADQLMPLGTKYFLTTDSDGMMKMESTPEHFAWNDKPYWMYRTWESLTEDDPKIPGAKVISDNLQWRPVTDYQLGFATDVFTMCVNIQLIPIDLLVHYRNHIESVHRKSFDEFMLEGRNEFPQTRTDFNSLGAYFYRFHRDRFHWFDVKKPPYPVDRKKSYWSHGGLNAGIEEEIKTFLA